MEEKSRIGRKVDAGVIKLPDSRRCISSFSSTDGVLRLAMSKSDLADVLRETGTLPRQGRTVVMQTLAAHDMGTLKAGEVIETDTYGSVRQIARSGADLPKPYYELVGIEPAYLLVVQRESLVRI